MLAEPAEGGALLEADDLDVLYGDYQILWGARIRVERGEVIAVGPPAAVTSDARVIEAYLGRAYAD